MSQVSGALTENNATVVPIEADAVEDFRFRVTYPHGTFQVQHGDFCVANRPSSYQKALVLLGEPGVHAAIVVEIEGVLRTVEVGPVGVFSRSFDEFCSAYAWVGILRPSASEDCRKAVAAEALRHLDEKSLSYSLTLCALIGAGGLARRMLPARLEAFVDRVGLGVASVFCAALGPSKVTCSSFVARCAAVSCPMCRPLLEWPVRSRVKAWRGMTTVTDLIRGPQRKRGETLREAVYALTSPTDLWAGVPAECKAVFSSAGVTILVDASASQPVCALQRSGRRQGPQQSFDMRKEAS